MTIEKRKYKRVNCDFKVSISNKLDSNTVRSKDGNISESGLFFKSNKRFEPMVMYDLVLKFPFLPAEKNCIICRAIVIWCEKEEQSDEYMTGFCFSEISRKDRKNIREFIKHKVE